MIQVGTKQNVQGSEMESINPATLEIFGKVQKTTVGELKDIVSRSSDAFLVWKNTPLKERISVLKNVKNLMMNDSDRLARLISLEMGRPIIESMVMEVEACVDLLDYYVRQGSALLRDRPVRLHNLFFKRRKSYNHYQPLGVLGIIAPWNWPLLIPLGCIAPALLAGNTVVFKHSELTPLLALEIEKCFQKAGLPDHVFQIVQGGGDIGQQLVASDIDKIFFVGSTAVGQKIMEQASRSLKKSVLEMGGNDPAIVCADCDLDVTTSGIVWGAFNNCGQNCNGIERVYVHQSITEPFLKQVVDKTEKLQIGDGLNRDTDIGPLVSEQQAQKMDEIIRDAIKNGAEILTGGQRLSKMKGYFYQPTVLLWNKETPYPRGQEIFGPILVITPVKDEKEAIELANRSDFGLTASIWSHNYQNAQQIARKLETGTVMINDSVVSFGLPEAGWTGIKKSGVGWIHGEKGLEEMVNIQYIHVEKQDHTQKFWWFPYQDQMYKAIKAGMAFLYSPIFFKIRALPRILRYFTSYLVLNKHRDDKY